MVVNSVNYPTLMIRNVVRRLLSTTAYNPRNPYGGGSEAQAPPALLSSPRQFSARFSISDTDIMPSNNCLVFNIQCARAERYIVMHASVTKKFAFVALPDFIFDLD